MSPSIMLKVWIIERNGELKASWEKIGENEIQNAYNEKNVP